jgi:hypothetical protein
MEPMANEEAGVPASSQHLADNQQRFTLARFLQAMTTFHHIDEVFLYFSNFIIQRYGAQVAQIWAFHVNQQGHAFPGLRSFASLDRSLPQHLVVNSHIVAIVEHALRAHRSTPLQAVDMAFPPNVATLLQRYGLNYSASSFFNSNALLLPPSTDFSVEHIPTPLAVTLLFFFQQIPHQNVLLSINNMFQQILPVAKSRGLLLVAPTNVGSSPVPSASLPEQRTVPVLFDLIPHRIEDPANNPLAASVAIVDEQARRFYAAINDRRTVRELSVLLRLEKNKVVAIVQMLLLENRIQLR